jgi:Protein of unknown function (DUF3618)
MSSHDGQPGPGGEPTDPQVEEIRADIERTREELADTVDALTARLDVKTRAKNAVQQTSRRAMADVTSARDRVVTTAGDVTTRVRTSATDEQGRPKPAVRNGGLAFAGLALAALAAVLWRRARR